MDRNAVQPNIAAAGRVEASQQAQQRALAAAACPQNGHKLPRRNGHGDSLENLHPPRAVLNPLLRVPNLDHPARRRIIVSFWLFLLACPLLAADRPVLVCYGDSITAGHGLESGQSFPDALQLDLDRRGYHYKVNNQGTSGATTKDAVADLHSILLLHPAVVIVEFGGNDGLRGLPLSETRRNLD